MVSLIRLIGAATLLASSVLADSNHHSIPRTHKRHHRHMDQGERDGLVSSPQIFEGRATYNETLDKRDSFTGRGTWFDVGLGACGQWSTSNQLIVALNSPQYGGGYPGPQCFKYITVQANGVTVGGVQIMDECPTCDWGGLDMSQGLFQRFADLGVGVLSITWWYDGDSGPSNPAPSSEAPSPPPPSPSPSPTPTSTNNWWSTSTWVAPSTSTTPWWNQQNAASSSTSTWVAPSSSSSVAPSSSSTSSVAPSSSSVASISSSSSSASSSQQSSSSVAPTTTNKFVIQASASPAPGSGSSENDGQIQASSNNLEAFSGLVAAYGQLIVVGAGGHPDE
ncbi:hypothetical protein BD324DRAFT_661339 [Kockovaella imperatae]|uniref:RlpA-like double-psi beta-barrel-protein domain-containing protein-containing protein n=1 Tax=Kockovaella imperatae TaxID=4999 RepID=A0A1Y1UB79_9TREE|nr:hypothetical protein BD324DRAFT_661339 [Kockovaella imperatae]ORX35291.1 hypothetical protein BD324DRAFT_661339 [Kockovaella imperatae]